MIIFAKASFLKKNLTFLQQNQYIGTLIENSSHLTVFYLRTCLLSNRAQTEPSIETERLFGCSKDEAGEEKVRESAMQARSWRCSSLSVIFTAINIFTFILPSDIDIRRVYLISTNYEHIYVNNQMNLVNQCRVNNDNLFLFAELLIADLFPFVCCRYSKITPEC